MTDTRIFLLIMGLVLSAFPCSAEEEPLYWAADAEGGAPYIFKDPQQPTRNIGFEVDLAEALSRELGRKIVHKQYQFGSLVPGLLRGDFDFAMNGLEVTPDRKDELRFTRPYYIYQQQLVVRADEERIRRFADCKGLENIQIGTLEDTAAQRILENEGIPVRIYDNQTDPYLDLELGRIDGVLLDLPIAVYYGKPNKNLKFAGGPFGDGYYAIAFRKDREEIAAEVDLALERIIASGEVRKIYEKWNIWNEEQEKLIVASTEDVTAASRRQWTLDRYFPLLLEGAAVTISLSFRSMALAVAIGLLIAVCRLYGGLPLRILATLYVEFFRGIPVLLLLFFLYYGLPSLAPALETLHPSMPTMLSTFWFWGPPLQLSAFQAAVLGFGLNYAAYESEIYRAGISSIPDGQWEASASLGMSGPLTFFRIILPQAIRFIIPPMTNDFVALFKDTSIVSIIAVVELTKQYQILSKSSLKYIEIGLVTALLYLVMSVPLGYLSRYLEKRWSGEE